MPKKKTEFHRSHQLKCLANLEKLEQVKKVFPEYQKTAQEIASLQWQLFYTIGAFNKNDDPFLLSFNDSYVDYRRYCQTIQYQVVGQLKSFISNRANDFARIVSRSSLDTETKKKLYLINDYQSWYDPTLTSEIGVLARRIFRHVLSKHRKPSFRRINMVLDAKVGRILPKEEDKAKHFAYWIKFSTLNLNHPILLPMESNDYYEKAAGTRNETVQVNQDLQGNLSFYFVKEQKIASKKEGKKLLGIDIGLRTLLATDCGDLLGRRFIDRLRKYDLEILKLTRELQKHQKPLSSNHRYQRLQQRFRKFLKNETHRCLNRLVELRNPDRIVLESLDFRNSKLSKEMNRFLRRFGKTEIGEKLKSLSEETGIKVVYINPAYTSQECRNCGYVDARNRQDEIFQCLFCGHKVHADINGASCVVLRSSWDEPLYIGKDQILQKLVENFLLTLERSNLSARKIDVLKSNPYFGKALKHLKGWQDTLSSQLLTKQLSSQGFS